MYKKAAMSELKKEHQTIEDSQVLFDRNCEFCFSIELNWRR